MISHYFSYLPTQGIFATPHPQSTVTLIPNVMDLFPSSPRFSSSGEMVPRLTGIDYVPNLGADPRTYLKPKSIEFMSTRLQSPLYQAQKLPENFNWNDNSKVTTPYDQKGCGSCWAVSTCTVLSDRFLIQKSLDKVPTISTSYAISCSNKVNAGCGGGFPQSLLEYAYKSGLGEEVNGEGKKCDSYDWCLNDTKCGCNGGSTTITSQEQAAQCMNNLILPCEDLVKECMDNPSIKPRKYFAGLGEDGNPWHIIGFEDADMTDQSKWAAKVNLIKQELMTKGPLIVSYPVFMDFMIPFMPAVLSKIAQYGVDISKVETWNSTDNIYIHGAYDKLYVDRNGNPINLNIGGSSGGLIPSKILGGFHAVAVVGWGTKKVDGQDVPYWITRNSWGTVWNKGGFFNCAMYDPSNKRNMMIGFDHTYNLQTSDGGSIKIGGFVVGDAGKMLGEDGKVIVNTGGDDKKAKWICDPVKHICSVDEKGTYITEDDCKKVCSGDQPIDMWTCDSKYQCVKDTKGKFKNQDDCKKNCGKRSKIILIVGIIILLILIIMLIR
jgi:hypothetical protein